MSYAKVAAAWGCHQSSSTFPSCFPNPAPLHPCFLQLQGATRLSAPFPRQFLAGSAPRTSAPFPSLSGSALTCSRGHNLCNVSVVPTRDKLQRQQGRGTGCPGWGGAEGLCWRVGKASAAGSAAIPSLSCSRAVVRG